MSQDYLAHLECATCRNINYQTRRNSKTIKKRLELQKFCNKCKKKTLHKETK